MPYSKYTLEDFIADEYFIKWVKSPNEESNAYWMAWISKNPSQKAIIQQAREIIQLLEIKEKQAPEGKFLEVWENIAQATEQKTNPFIVEQAEPRSLPLVSSGKFWLRIAASVMLFFGLGMWSYVVYQKSRVIVITTAYGESRTLFLPDSTKVMLNANSILRYSPYDFDENHREVSLDGQAFFAVTHQRDNQNFRVQTSELQVEVLGTRFDVNSRRGKTKVILEEGKVRLDVDRDHAEKKSVMMKPGDYVEVSDKTEEISRKTVNPEHYLAWRNNRLEFNGATLQEIAQLIEDNYGYKIIFQDEDLKGRKFTGSSSNENIQELLDKLSLLFEMDVTQKGNEINIGKQ